MRASYGFYNLFRGALCTRGSCHIHLSQYFFTRVSTTDHNVRLDWTKNQILRSTIAQLAPRWSDNCQKRNPAGSFTLRCRFWRIVGNSAIFGRICAISKNVKRKWLLDRECHLIQDVLRMEVIILVHVKTKSTNMGPKIRRFWCTECFWRYKIKNFFFQFF